MAVRVVPPRGRPEASESVRYPGLTPEERGLDVPTTPLATPELGPPPPLWVIPSEVPRAQRQEGFMGPLPGADLLEPPPPPEGLFDVPGLLERLWLARALEATHHERAQVPGGGPSLVRTPLPSDARSGAVPGGTPSRPSEAFRTPGGEALLSPAAPAPTAATGPRSWICPYCYLTNDAGATTCRGCRSGALHL